LKVLIADDHALFRDGLRQLLDGISPELAIVESRDLDETLDAVVADPELDLLLLDLCMPGMAGVGSLRRLIRKAPSVPIIVISASEESELIRDILEAGAMGFVPKSESSRVMKHAIELVLGGGVYVPPSLLQLSRGSRSDANLGLTPRQKDVLRLILEGRSNKEIARSLELSVATVKAHVGAAYRALEVTTRAQATAKAQRIGLFAGREAD
jgi:DNA-binding NarL/FixJ family response regulator